MKRSLKVILETQIQGINSDSQKENNKILSPNLYINRQGQFLCQHGGGTISERMFTGLPVTFPLLHKGSCTQFSIRLMRSGIAWVMHLCKDRRKASPDWTQTNTCVGIFGVLNL